MNAVARTYLELGETFLDTPPPRLIAVGGLSGSGKSALAAAIAPALGTAPGAVHLRSDVIRKLLFDHDPEARLPPGAYVPRISKRVFGQMRDHAGAALAGGRAVVCDATYMDAAERDAIARVASNAGAQFMGLWLDVSPEIMAARIGARRGDASDADETVLDSQLAADVGEIGWGRIAADGPADEIRRNVMQMLDHPFTPGEA